MVAALLKVPEVSNAGVAGVTIAELNVICKSYEITPFPIRSPTVIGTIIRPGVAMTAGKDTDIGGIVGVGVAVLVAVLAAVFVGVFVEVFVAVAVGVNVAVAVGVGVNVSVCVGVAVFVDVAVAAGIETLPFVMLTDGTPSLNRKAK